MKKLKNILLLLVCLSLALTTLAMISISNDPAEKADAQAIEAADAESSIIRVLLSTGDLTEINLTVSGAYSTDAGPLPSGQYSVKNENNTLNLINNEGVILLTNPAALLIRENQNPDPDACNLISLQAGGYVRNYLGSMKFWLDGPYVDVINHVFLEKYLYGVVAYEMSNSFPLEALKAQAVAARCYAVKRLEGSRPDYYDISDTSGDQVYKGYNASLANVRQAVDATAGQVLLFNGSIITAYYSASNGGQTDRTENVWSAALPYFKIREDPYDIANPSSLQKSVSFPIGTQTDKAADLPPQPIRPIALGEAYGSSRVTLYQKPDTGSPAITTIKRGERLFIYDRNSAWTKVRFGEGYGFIMTRYCQSYSLQATIRYSGKKLYAAATSQSAAILTLPRYAKVGVLAVGNYYQVSYQDKTGYILKSNLTLTKSATPPMAAMSAGDTLTITARINFRTGPSTSKKSLGMLAAGTRVTLISAGTSWHQVSYNGQAGYIYAQYSQLVIPSMVLTSEAQNSSLQATSSASSSDAVMKAGDTLTITARINFRTGPSTSYQSLGMLAAGTQVTLISAGTLWHQVSYNGQAGYIYAQYSRWVVPPAAPVPVSQNIVPADSSNIRYTEDDLDPALLDFLKTLAITMLDAQNAALPAGRKYDLSPGAIKIKAILGMTAIQTSAHPYCHHNPDSTDGAPHDAANCPSIDFTGARMSVLLKVQQEDTGKVTGFNRLDYTWDFEFVISDYLKSALYPQWQAFSPSSSLRIFAVEKGSNPSGLASFNLINRRYGHGIGLSQRGAQQRAKDPNPAISQYQNILAFYYPNTLLSDSGLTEPPIPPVPTPTPEPTATPTPTPTPEPTAVPNPTPTPEPTTTAAPTTAAEPTTTAAETTPTTEPTTTAESTTTAASETTAAAEPTTTAATGTADTETAETATTAATTA